MYHIAVEILSSLARALYLTALIYDCLHTSHVFSSLGKKCATCVLASVKVNNDNVILDVPLRDFITQRSASYNFETLC